MVEMQNHALIVELGVVRNVKDCTGVRLREYYINNSTVLDDLNI
jgi:hypothetical protein